MIPVTNVLGSGIEDLPHRAFLPRLATVAPLAYTIPVQLIAYHTAVVMSTDVSAVSKFAVSEPSALCRGPGLRRMRVAKLPCGRKGHVMRPSALEITAGEFAFATGHRLNAVSFVGGLVCSGGLFMVRPLRLLHKSSHETTAVEYRQMGSSV
jgi:hypothetical protein